MKKLLGKKFDSVEASEYKLANTNGMIQDETRGTCAFQVEENQVFSVEEMISMQLAHAKKQAEKYGSEQVSGAVITVPPYYNEFERRALLDAAEMAGLRVLQLMNDETAGTLTNVNE